MKDEGYTFEEHEYNDFDVFIKDSFEEDFMEVYQSQDANMKIAFGNIYLQEPYTNDFYRCQLTNTKETDDMIEKQIIETFKHNQRENKFVNHKDPFTINKTNDDTISESSDDDKKNTKVIEIINKPTGDNNKEPVLFKTSPINVFQLYCKNDNESSVGNDETVNTNEEISQKKTNGKKRQRKIRKYKPDDIRKKIKARFHKTLKNSINELLKNAGSQKLLDVLPQSFICNISKEKNKDIFKLTYQQLLEKDFTKEIDESKYKKKKVDEEKYKNNKDVLEYLKKNPEITKRSGFDVISQMTYCDLIKEYFNSIQFECSIERLKMENESEEYIKEYCLKAKHYVKFFCE